MRHLILLGITFLPTMGREVEILRALVRSWYLPADLPALRVLIAAARRRAEAGPVWRLVWLRGRVLLTLSALAYPIPALGGLMASGPPLVLGLDGMILGSTLASLAVVAYL